MKDTLIKIKKLIQKFLTILVDCIIPILPIMIGAGMINVLLIVLGPTALNILSETSNTYIVLSFVASAGFYFMPIFIAISSAEVFETNKYLAAFIGAMLLSPTFVELVKSGANLSIFGIPITPNDYSNQVITSLIAIAVMSKIYNFLYSHLSENIRAILTPLLTIIIMIPIAFCAIGPLGVFIGDKLVSLILTLSKLGPIGNALMAAMIPYITLAGLGGANLSAMLILASTGCDPILFFSNVIWNNVLGFVTLAIYLKDRKSEILASAITSSIAGTSEPALFGVAVSNPVAIINVMIGCFCAGLYTGLMGVKSYAMASFGIFGVITTIGPDSSIVHAIIALIIGCSVGFILTYITYTKKKN